jgi:hypothetical protein
MNNETVSHQVETVEQAKTGASRDESQSRPIAGVSLPDGPLITAAIELAQRLSEPYLFNHAMRSWLFAETIGGIKGNRLRPRGRGYWHDTPRYWPYCQRIRAQSLRSKWRRCRAVVHQRQGSFGSPNAADLGSGCAQFDAISGASQGAGGGGRHDGHRTRLWWLWR